MSRNSVDEVHGPSGIPLVLIAGAVPGVTPSQRLEESQTLRLKLL